MAVVFERRRFTVDEFERMAEAGILTEDDRVELIHGEIIQMSPIGRRHMAVVNRCAGAFADAFARRRVIVSVQNPVRLGDEFEEPQPDLALLRPREDDYESTKPEPPDIFLVIEVADSSLTYDRQVKLPLYAQAGIGEAWLLDLEGEALEVHRQPGPRGYALVRRYRRGERVAPEALPDLEIAVEQLLGRARA